MRRTTSLIKPTTAGLVLFLAITGPAGYAALSVAIEHVGDATATLSWPTVSGKDYRLWTKTNLADPWAAVGDPVPGTGGRISRDVASADRASFFRVSESGSSVGPDPARFVWIDTGIFTMGSPATEKDRDPHEGPQTVVTLTRGFWMSRFEVTQQEYLALVGSNPSRFTNSLSNPVEKVTWGNATNYCRLLTESEQAAGRLPAGYAYRLPTEAEWEYVCRAGTTTRLHYGDDPNYTLLEAYAWYDKNAGFVTHPVGRLAANPWGLHDLMGNVSEWCQDWYGSLPGGSVTDPQGPPSGTQHVLRGGAIISGGASCRSAYRSYAGWWYSDSYAGFRPVLARLN